MLTLHANLFPAAGLLTVCLGISTATPAAAAVREVHGDFTRDRSADFTVYRPAEGVWYTRDRVGTVILKQWGLPGDIPVPADYDGDGRQDWAVWRPGAAATSGFYVLPSSGRCPTPMSPYGSGCAIQWGLDGDIPVPADYTGDGVADLAVWRPTTGTWYVRHAAGVLALQHGLPGDIPVPGDYRGAGKAAFAVWRPSNGTWYVDGLPPRQWGLKGDTPVPGDYDGNGMTDYVVWRPKLKFPTFNSGPWSSFRLRYSRHLSLRAWAGHRRACRMVRTVNGGEVGSWQ